MPRFYSDTIYTTPNGHHRFRLWLHVGRFTPDGMYLGAERCTLTNLTTGTEKQMGIEELELMISEGKLKRRYE